MRLVRNRLAVPVAAIALFALGSCGGKSGGVIGVPMPPAITLWRFATLSATVTAITAAPNDTGRVFAVEQSGIVRIVKHNVLVARPFLDISSEVLNSGEEGLLGMAFAPDYAASRTFYLCYVDNGSNLLIRRFQVSAADPDSADALTESAVFSLALPTGVHHGGTILFGPDGKLYIGIGDGGPQNDGRLTGQDNSDLFANVLRLTVTSSGTYSVPADNPFVGVAGVKPEIWSYGLRNPWLISFDRQTGDFYVPDVGQDKWEEINVAPAPTIGKGVNYGWSVFEGTHCGPNGTCDPTGKTMPQLEYAHNSGAGECAVIGGRVYRGKNLPGLTGLYFYSDLCAQWLRSFRYSGGVADQKKDWGVPIPDSPSSFGEDANGEIYIGTSGGSVYKIMP